MAMGKLARDVRPFMSRLVGTFVLPSTRVPPYAVPMQTPRGTSEGAGARLPLLLLTIFLALILFGGGASRADAAGQLVVRAAAWLALMVLVFYRAPTDWRAIKVAMAALAAGVAVAFVQLIPLPPALWTRLPGHSLLANAAIAIGEQQPWRPISLDPDGTRNALFSLIVPVTAVLIMGRLGRSRDRAVLIALGAMVLFSAAMGVLQFSGARFDNPLINDAPGVIGGTFANPNHLALLMAIGCILAPVTCFELIRRPLVSLGMSAGLVTLFILVILATGSRAGLVLGACGIAYGILMVRKRAFHALAQLSRSVRLILVAAIAATVAGSIAASIWLGRAASVGRMVSADAIEDKRFAVWTTVTRMIGEYLPFGSGLGAFDAAYRIAEPAANLDTRYMNQAHNDWLQIVLDAGIVGAILAIAALVIWVLATRAAWGAHDTSYARMASGILLLIFLASVVDYAARTPIIMTFAAIAAVWLCRHGVTVYAPARRV